MASQPKPETTSSRLDSETAESVRKDLVRLLVRRTGDTELAADLAQEALVHLVQGLPRYRGAAALRSWARRIALNVWRDYLRRTAVRPEGHLTVSVSALLDALDPNSQEAGAAENAQDQRATHACLLEATRRLPLDSRRVLLLHDFGEMPLEQIAAVLDCSMGTARVRLHRARKRLAELCRADCTCEPGADGAPVCAPKEPSRTPPPSRRPPRGGRT
jgi:RNA polymerase sigma-70 factor (ECF subfamily)